MEKAFEDTGEEDLAWNVPSPMVEGLGARHEVCAKIDTSGG